MGVFGYDAESPPQITKRTQQMILCEHFGWTPDEVQRMNVQDYGDAIAYMNGIGRAREPKDK